MDSSTSEIVFALGFGIVFTTTDCNQSMQLCFCSVLIFLNRSKMLRSSRSFPIFKLTLHLLRDLLPQEDESRDAHSIGGDLVGFDPVSTRIRVEVLAWVRLKRSKI